MECEIKIEVPTPANPDCVESWPFGGRLSGHSACGIYHYDEKTRKRTGGLQFIQFAQEELKAAPATGQTVAVAGAHTHRTNTGIADLRWLPPVTGASGATAAILCVTSGCSLCVFRLNFDDEEGGKIGCSKSHELNILADPEDYIGLGIDAQQGSSSECGNVAISLSNGTVAAVDVGMSRVSKSWMAHEGSEVWAVAMGEEGNVVATGADDCAMKVWDLRTPCTDPDIQNRRDHAAGVTALKFLDSDAKLLSGSYDEQVRVWDIRELRRPLLTEKACGGVWRLRNHPRRPRTILLAGCHGGCEEWEIDASFSKLDRKLFLPAQPGSLFYGITSHEVSALPRIDSQNGLQVAGPFLRLSSSFWQANVALW